MAFNILGFQFNRGITTANAQGQGFTAIAHTYKSTTDTLAQIATPGYFPINFDGSAVSDKVFVRDWLFIKDSVGATSFVNITGLNPVTLGPDLFVAGSFIVIAPIVAVDNNAIVISGNNVAMEIADATHSGIITNVAQTFGGSKTFLDILKATNINGELPSDLMFIGAGQDPGKTVTIGNASVNVFLPGGLVTNNISNVTAGSTLAIHSNFDGLTTIGQDTAAATTGILTNRIDTISAGGHPLVIAPNTVFPIEIGNATAPILAKGGVKWDIGGGTISAYAQSIVGITWSGAIGPTNGSITLNKFEDIVFATISRIPLTAESAPLAITSGAIIPAAFLPTQNVENVVQVVDNDIFQVGSYQITPAGVINIFSTVGQGLFSSSGNAAMGTIVASWSTTFP